MLITDLIHIDWPFLRWAMKRGLRSPRLPPSTSFAVATASPLSWHLPHSSRRGTINILILTSVRNWSSYGFR